MRAAWFSIGSVLMAFGCDSQSRQPERPAIPPRSEEPREPASLVRPLAPKQEGRPDAPPSAPAIPPAREPRFHSADIDPENDGVVAPPDAVLDCQERLKESGFSFHMAELPLRQPRNGIPTCGANDAVVLKRSPSGVDYRPPALVTCRLALALSEFDTLLQELAHEHLGAKVTRLEHAGTYNCRKMVRFNLVSEHSYGNAIDVRSVTLEGGKKLSVLSDYGPIDQEPTTKQQRFLRRLGELAYDENVFSVSLGPHWDALHRDHFHFDMARYRVDGSR